MMSKLYDEEDDPIVQEFDIILQRDEEDGLYLLQNILKPVYIDPPEYEKGKFRPINNMLQTSYRVDKDSRHFELNQNEMSENEDMSFRKYQTLFSERIDTPSNAFTCSVVDWETKQIHIIPLASVFQMKPLMMSDAKAQEMTEPRNVVKRGISDDDGLQPLEVRNLRRDSHKQLSYNRETYTSFVNKLDEEAWNDLDVHARNSYESKLAYDQLKKNSMEVDQTENTGQGNTTKGHLDAEHAFSASAVDYLDMLAPRTQLRIHTDTVKDAVAVDVDYKAHIRTTLSKVIAARCEDLLPFLSHTPVKLFKQCLKYLQQIAVMVRGAWVLNSELYFNDKFGVMQGGDTTRVLRRCAIRDVVLAQIFKSKSGIIQLSELKDLFKFQAHEMREALMGIVIPEKDGRNLKFKCKDDVRFMRQQRNLYDDQITKWKQREYDALLSLGASVALAEGEVNKHHELPSNPTKHEHE